MQHWQITPEASVFYSHVSCAPNRSNLHSACVIRGTSVNTLDLQTNKAGRWRKEFIRTESSLSFSCSESLTLQWCPRLDNRKCPWNGPSIMLFKELLALIFFNPFLCESKSPFWSLSIFQGYYKPFSPLALEHPGRSCDIHVAIWWNLPEQQWSH